MPSKAVQFDLRMAARSYGQEALDFMVACMRDETLDKDTRLKAAALIHDRGYGRPQMLAEVDVHHKFVIAPETMGIDQWLKCKGQSAPNDWLEQQQRQQQQQQRKTEGPTIDLKAEERLEPELPLALPVYPSTLN
jgi:hypothetical protein